MARSLFSKLDLFSRALPEENRMTSSIAQPAERPAFTNLRILSLLLGILITGWLAIAPFIAQIGGMILFQFVPKSFSAFTLAPRPGILPEPLIGLIISFASFLLQAIVFFPLWLITRKRANWEPLHAIAAGLLAASVYLLAWSLAGLPFSAQSVGPSIVRMILTAALLLMWLRPIYRSAPAGLGKPAPSTLLLALGAAAVLLLPWLILGALGTVPQTLTALAQALSYGAGEELLLRALIPALLVRATGRPRLGFLLGLIIGFAMQPGYILPLGDWMSLFRLFNVVAVGLLATEFAARGSLWPAILVHTAFEFGFPAWVDSRMEFSIPHPAALESLGLMVLLAGILFCIRLLANRIAKKQPLGLRLSVTAGFAVLALAGSAGSYVAWGHPGFTPDGFLIVLREQADVQKAASISDRTQRIEYVYQTLVQTAERTQAPARAELDRLGIKYRPHYLINMIEVSGRTDLMSAFAARPEVKEVILNPNVRMANYSETLDLLAINTPGQGVEWNIAAVQAPEVWAKGVTGKGIVVAGADTGADWTHPALQSKYRGWSGGVAQHDYNWFDPWDGSAEPMDDNGHGTYTVGLAVGGDGAGNQIGVAPGAQWIACRNMRNGIGNPGTYVSCMEFFLAPFPHGGDPFRDGRPDLAPDVVNNSWGCPAREGCRADTLNLALQNLKAAGIMMVAAAGNDGPACGTVGDPPANSAAAFSVGASDRDNALAFFSSRGPSAGLLKPDITAPGYMVRSSIPGGKYTISAGTSAASPHVAGAVALLWSADPSLVGDIDRTEEILRRTALPMSIGQYCSTFKNEGTPCLCGQDSQTAVPNNSYGAGILDVYAAYGELSPQ
jgi:subtilisin family serine protease